MTSTAATDVARVRRRRTAAVWLAIVAVLAAGVPVVLHLGYATVRWENHAWGWLLVDLAAVIGPVVPLVVWLPRAGRTTHSESLDVGAFVLSLVASFVSLLLAVFWI